jgi:hypothetical protein
MGWNGHEKHCEKADLMWRTKMAFPKLKIVVLRETAEERKPDEKRPWK